MLFRNPPAKTNAVKQDEKMTPQQAQMAITKILNTLFFGGSEQQGSGKNNKANNHEFFNLYQLVFAKAKLGKTLKYAEEMYKPIDGVTDSTKVKDFHIFISETMLALDEFVKADKIDSVFAYDNLTGKLGLTKENCPDPITYPTSAKKPEAKKKFLDGIAADIKLQLQEAKKIANSIPEFTESFPGLSFYLEDKWKLATPKDQLPSDFAKNAAMKKFDGDKKNKTTYDSILNSDINLLTVLPNPELARDVDKARKLTADNFELRISGSIDRMLSIFTERGLRERWAQEVGASSELEKVFKKMKDESVSPLFDQNGYYNPNGKDEVLKYTAEIRRLLPHIETNILRDYQDLKGKRNFLISEELNFLEKFIDAAGDRSLNYTKYLDKVESEKLAAAAREAAKDKNKMNAAGGGGGAKVKTGDNPTAPSDQPAEKPEEQNKGKSGGGAHKPSAINSLVDPASFINLDGGHDVDTATALGELSSAATAKAIKPTVVKSALEKISTRSNAA